MTIDLNIPDTAVERAAIRAIDVSPNALKEIRSNAEPGLRGAFPRNAATILALIDALEEARALLLKVESKLVKEGCVYTTEPIGIELSAWRRRNVP